MRLLATLFGVIAILAPSLRAQSVQISAPSNGATVTSPVRFVASGSAGVSPLRIYVDSVSKFTSQSNKLDTSLALANGQHRVVVVGWDSSGLSYTASESINVAATAPAPSTAGIAVASPTNGATIASPVQFAATATAPTGRSINAFRIYIDNQAAYQVNAASVNTGLSLTSGIHYVVFQAWDTAGAVYKQPLSINVSATSAPVPSPTPTPTPSPNSPFQNDLSATATWLRSYSVAGDGAILYGSSKIIPYYSNLAAIGLTHDPASYSTVQRWMQWYINHLNWPDKYGLYGTTYDYDYSNGQEVSRNYADSTDSYAATFLSLALAFYHTGDPSAQAYVKTLGYQLDVIGGVLIQTQQSDGLTWAKPDYKIKYLMDNCEGYRGLRDLAQLFQTSFNDPTKAAYYNAAAGTMLKGINSMWMNGSWAVYKTASGTLAAPSMGKWYPDATSQLFPALEGVIPVNDPRSQQVYTNLNNAWPGWPSLSYNAQDPFPWVLVGNAAVMMGDTQRVNVYVQSLESKYVNKGFPWTWYSAEAGWFLRLNAYILGARPM